MRQIKAGNPQRSWLSGALRWLAPAAVAVVAVFALLPKASVPAPGVYDEITTLDIVELVSPDDYALLTSVEAYEEDDLLTAEL